MSCTDQKNFFLPDIGKKNPTFKFCSITNTFQGPLSCFIQNLRVGVHDKPSKPKDHFNREASLRQGKACQFSEIQLNLSSGNNINLDKMELMVFGISVHFLKTSRFR